MEFVLPPTSLLRKGDAGPAPATIGAAVDYAPVCHAALQTSNDSIDNVMTWIATHQPAVTH